MKTCGTQDNDTKRQLITDMETINLLLSQYSTEMKCSIFFLKSVVTLTGQQTNMIYCTCEQYLLEKNLH